jgi:hypothetical protein
MSKIIFQTGVRVPDRDLQTIEEVVEWFRAEQERVLNALNEGIAELVARNTPTGRTWHRRKEPRCSG